MNNQEPQIHVMPDKFHSGRSSAPTPTIHRPVDDSRFRRFLPLIIIIILVLLIVGGVAFYLFFALNQTTNTVVPQTSVNVNVPLNANKNLNSNINASLPENYNTNVPATNLNVNSSANVNLNPSSQLKESLDSDRDLLTDVEENVFGTKASGPDSDSDGYIDGQEILAGYNPLGAGSLIQSPGLVTLYQNPVFPYQILYPSSWLVDALDQTQQTVLFTSATGEFIEVTVADNPQAQTASDWYLELYPDLRAKNLTKVNNLDKTLNGIKSIQGYTVYYSDGQYIYAITYNFGTKLEINFNNIFEMMYLNFSFNPDFQTSEPDLNINTNTNINANANVNADLNTNYSL